MKLLICVRLFATPWPLTCQAPQSVHGIFQTWVVEWVSTSFPRVIFPTQGSNPGLPHCRQTLLPSEPPGRSKTIYLFCCSRSSLQQVGPSPLMCVTPKHAVECICQAAQLFQQVLDTHSTKRFLIRLQKMCTLTKTLAYKFQSDDCKTAVNDVMRITNRFSATLWCIFIVALGLLLMLSTDKI